ncbi:hypothetical protein EK904_011585 [Melospiza melodia maxima]|nr:hypothetical protein EK904_011585 [Melospiza melodia maxima]
MEIIVLPLMTLPPISNLNDSGMFGAVFSLEDSVMSYFATVKTTSHFLSKHPYPPPHTPPIPSNKILELLVFHSYSLTQLNLNVTMDINSSQKAEPLTLNGSAICLLSVQQPQHYSQSGHQRNCNNVWLCQHFVSVRSRTGLLQDVHWRWTVHHHDNNSSTRQDPQPDSTKASKR